MESGDLDLYFFDGELEARVGQAMDILHNAFMICTSAEQAKTLIDCRRRLLEIRLEIRRRWDLELEKQLSPDA